MIYSSYKNNRDYTLNGTAPRVALNNLLHKDNLSSCPETMANENFLNVLIISDRIIVTRSTSIFLDAVILRSSGEFIFVIIACLRLGEAHNSTIFATSLLE